MIPSFHEWFWSEVGMELELDEVGEELNCVN